MHGVGIGFVVVHGGMDMRMVMLWDVDDVHGVAYMFCLCAAGAGSTWPISLGGAF